MTTIVDPQRIERFVRQLLERYGLQPQAAALAAETFVRTDLRGIHSHGLYYLSRYAPLLRGGGIRTDARPHVVHETPATAVFDGDGGMGQVVAPLACDVAAAKAARVGCATVLVRNSNHFGAAGIYALRLAEQGFIGIVASNAPPAITAPGGTGKVLSNAPTAYAVPSPDGAPPVLLDIAFSVAAGTKVVQAAARGEQVPAGWILDGDGNPSTDPADLRPGGLVPIAGHKGYGLAILVELLAGALSGAHLTHAVLSYAKVHDRPSGTGHWIQAMDIAAFMPVAEFAQRVAALRDELHSSGRASGTARILLPGELEAEHESASQAHGLELDEAIWTSLLEVAIDRRLETELEGARLRPSEDLRWLDSARHPTDDVAEAETRA